MPLPSRRIFLALTLLLVVCSATVQIALGNKNKQPALPELNEQKRALQALNRLTFGPRPGDVERVMAIGVDKWIDQQLHPEKIDDRALDAASGSISHAAHGHARDCRELSRTSR